MDIFRVPSNNNCYKWGLTGLKFGLLKLWKKIIDNFRQIPIFGHFSYLKQEVREILRNLKMDKKLNLAQLFQYL